MVHPVQRDVRNPVVVARVAEKYEFGELFGKACIRQVALRNWCRPIDADRVPHAAAEVAMVVRELFPGLKTIVATDGSEAAAVCVGVYFKIGVLGRLIKYCTLILDNLL